MKKISAMTCWKPIFFDANFYDITDRTDMATHNNRDSRHNSRINYDFLVFPDSVFRYGTFVQEFAKRIQHPDEQTRAYLKGQLVSVDWQNAARDPYYNENIKFPNTEAGTTRKTYTYDPFSALHYPIGGEDPWIHWRNGKRLTQKDVTGSAWHAEMQKLMQERFGDSTGTLIILALVIV